MEKNIDLTKFNIGGYLKSPKDIRNYKISRVCATVNVFPAEFELDVSKLADENQLSIGMCVSEAMCHQLEYAYGKLFSLGWVYGNRSDTDYHGVGMYPSEMLSHGKNDGFILREDLPTIREMPQMEAIVSSVKADYVETAAAYKLVSYVTLENADEIKSALYQLRNLVLTGIQVYLPFMQADRVTGIVSEVPQELIDDGHTLGGHEIIIYGWNEYGFKVLNSWGNDSWGVNDCAIIPYSYPLSESWSITDIVAVPVVVDPVVPTPVTKWWRVQTESDSFLATAKETQAFLATKGYPNTYIDKVGDQYKVQIGAFSIEQNARNLSAELTAKGIENFVIQY